MSEQENQVPDITYIRTFASMSENLMVDTAMSMTHGLLAGAGVPQKEIECIINQFWGFSPRQIRRRLRNVGDFYQLLETNGARSSDKFMSFIPTILAAILEGMNKKNAHENSTPSR